MKKESFNWNEWAKVIGEMTIGKPDSSWTTIADFAEGRPGQPMSLTAAARLLFALYKAGKAERKQYLVVLEGTEPKRLWHYRLK